MKLVQSRMEHADTITTDDGRLLAVIYYSVEPLDDEGTKTADAFRKWFKDANDALLLFTSLEEREDEPPSAG